MANILVVYHDQIPKHRARLRDPSTQDRTFTQTKGSDSYTCACVPNWHQPMSMSRRVRTIQDYTNNALVIDTAAFDNCDPYQYDAYIFVPPLDLSTNAQADPQALLTTCMRTNGNAYWMVVNFVGFEQELMPFDTIKGCGFLCSNAETLVSANVVQREFEGYLSYRMSHDLSEMFATRIGVTPGQMRTIELFALNTQCDVPELSIRYEMSDGAMITLHDAAGWISFNTNEATLEAIVEALNNNKSINDLQALGNFYPSRELLTSLTLLAKHVPQHGSAYYERLVTLAAMNFISNPFVDKSVKKVASVVQNNISCIERLYPKSATKAPLLGKDPNTSLGVWCDLNRGASELLEYNDRLVDTFLDIHDHVLNTLTADLSELGVTIVGAGGRGHGLCFKKDALAGTHLPIQSGIEFSYVGTSTTQVAKTFNIKMRSLNYNAANQTKYQSCVISKELCRLLSKKYIKVSQGGGYHLTDFGACVYSLVDLSYGDTLKALDINPAFSGLISLDLANKRLADSIASVNPKKLKRKHITTVAKAKGKEREFQLVLKNTRRGKQVYWKSKTVIRGVLPKLKQSRIVLRVLPNLSLSKQQDKQLTALIKCSCGELTALWKYDAKGKRSTFKCVSCGSVHDHYINFRRA